MKKRVFGKRLSRSKSAKRALFRALTRALVIYGKIETTQAKAKAVKPFVDKLVTLAKVGDVASRRKVYALLGNDRKTTDDIFAKIVPALADTDSGFTRVINLPFRRGDRAKMVRFEWSKEIPSDKKQVKSDKKKSGNKKLKETKSSKAMIKGKRNKKS
jgi:large subunit ribosomal protein L17